MMTLAERQSPTERFVRRHSRLLLANAAAFGIWQLTDVLTGAMPGGAGLFLRGASLIACLTWAVLLGLLVRDQRMVRQDAALRSEVFDERARDVRLRAYRTAFWGALVSAALLTVAETEHLIPAHSAARFVVVTGVTTFIVAYMAFDRES
jgi:hypothetical protein